ncbi:uncharacterized protein LOC141629294 [Silene latifolia]|uniref:uncharacterized protein LOC141629294 n=1 Tax=Silene latifolia TaxID=37657 RepID=UPI003D7720DC
MGAYKSPGPDGIPAIFYHKCWHFIKSDFTKAVLSILNSGVLLREVNRTFIALIPKCDNPERVQDYCPISLCNVFMRIVTKCIANRLRKIMGYLVGQSQNAFIQGRHISDNILIAHEAIYNINSYKKGRYGRFAFKADMSKAYDRVRWDFLQAVLKKFGFPDKTIKLIMGCVNSVTYEVLLNGSPLQQFRPSCGLRQGDPLSPYLFILCMEVLSYNVEHAHQVGRIRGIKLCRGVSPLTHLFFADDSVFFLQDKGDSARQLKLILDDYCRASGQVLNEDKSGIFFSPSTTLGKARHCLATLKITKNMGLASWKPGCDSNLNVWTTKWVGGEYPEPKDVLLAPELACLKDLRVKDLCFNQGGWNEAMIRLIFKDEWINKILAMPFSTSQKEDRIYWLLTSTGDYTVKSGYASGFERYMEDKGAGRAISRMSVSSKLFCKRNLWRLPGPNAWKVLLWKILAKSLPVGEEFARRKLSGVDTCFLCSTKEVESLEHLFRDCYVTNRIWAGTTLGINADQVLTVALDGWIINWILYLGKLEEGDSRILQFLATIWSIWTLRNNIIFRGNTFTPNVFFRLWSQTVATALSAELSARVKGEINQASDMENEEGKQLIRRGKPFYLVGDHGSWQMVSVKLDASWSSSYDAAVGWTVSSTEGITFYEGRKRFLAESLLQAESLGVKMVME